MAWLICNVLMTWVSKLNWVEGQAQQHQQKRSQVLSIDKPQENADGWIISSPKILLLVLQKGLTIQPLYSPNNQLNLKLSILLSFDCRTLNETFFTVSVDNTASNMGNMIKWSFVNTFALRGSHTGLGDVCAEAFCLNEIIISFAVLENSKRKQDTHTHTLPLTHTTLHSLAIFVVETVVILTNCIFTYSIP